MSDQKEPTGEVIEAEATIEREINGNKISEKGTVHLETRPGFSSSALEEQARINTSALEGIAQLEKERLTNDAQKIRQQVASKTGADPWASKNIEQVISDQLNTGRGAPMVSPVHRGPVRLQMTPDGKDLIVLPDAARPRLSGRASSEASQNSTEQPKTLTTDEIVEASKRLRGEVEQHRTKTEIAKIMRDVLVDAINELYPMMSAHRWREAEFFLKSPDFMLLGVDSTNTNIFETACVGRLVILASRTKGPPRGTTLYHASGEALVVKYYYPTNQCRAYIENYSLVKTCEGLFHHFNTERITDMLDEKYGLAPPRYEERNGQ